MEPRLKSSNCTQGGATTVLTDQQAFMAHPRKPGPGTSLAFKLTLLVLLGTAAVFGAAFYYNYHYAREMLLRSVQRQAEDLTHSVLNKIDAALNDAEQVPDFLGALFESGLPDQQGTARHLEDFLRSTPSVYGSAVALAPGVFGGNGRTFALYAFRSDDGVQLKRLDHDDYDYLASEWYAVPMEHAAPWWTEPYFDQGGGETDMATYAVPFRRGTGQGAPLAGVVTADIALDELQALVADIRILETGRAFLLSRQGVFMAAPESWGVMHQNIFDLADRLGEPAVRDLGRRMVQGEEGVVSAPGRGFGEPSRVCFAPLLSAGWSLGVVMPEDELLADLHALSRDVLLIGLAGFALLFLVVAGISLSIARPIRELASRSREMAGGNLDVELPSRASTDEVGELTRSFDAMREALKEYIANLTETTRAKERMEAELKIAHTIQMNFLPKRFPPFPDVHSFSLHAVLEPAREVGGDLYDFFLLDDGRLFVMVGDVSDKGVPAALFMAVTRTLVKGVAAGESDPARVLDKVNRELCHDNEALLFVTMFCGVLDCETGEFVYSNAGHNPPLVVPQREAPRWLELPSGVMLGVLPEASFETRRVRLQEGETLLAYTDGVTEAMDGEGRLYSGQRLLAEAGRLQGLAPAALDTALLESVHNFANGAEQSDDITILALEYSGARCAAQGEHGD